MGCTPFGSIAGLFGEATVKPLRAYTNILKLRLNMLFKRVVINNYPVVAYIEPTAFCNLRCPACPTGLQLNLRPPAKMQMELFQAALDEIGDYVFELVMYNWGEPLLHPQTPTMIAYAKSKNIEVSLSTNFSLNLTDDYLEQLVRSGLDRLIISLDGASPETYQHYRRQGDFDQVRENMRRIRSMKQRFKIKTPTIEWQFLVFKHNEHEIETVRSNYQQWGADHLTIEGAQMPFSPYDKGFEPSSLPEYNIYHPKHSYRKKSERQLKSRRPCSWLYGSVVLNPNASVSPCCATAAQKDDFGIYDTKEGYFTLINNLQYQKARSLFKREKGFATCDDQMDVVASRLQGMSSHVSDKIADDQLICHQCPMPFRQDDVHKTIARVGYNTLKQSFKNRSIRSLIAFLLMGGPNAAGIQWLFRQMTNRLFSWNKTLSKG